MPDLSLGLKFEGIYRLQKYAVLAYVRWGFAGLKETLNKG